MTQTYEQAVKKVVDFWIEKSFRTPLNQNNGDGSPQGGMTFLLMNMVSARAQETITDEKIKLFENKLTEILLLDNPRNINIGVDYHPDKELSDAAAFAGLDAGCFPCKTYTWINKQTNTATSKYQYGGQIVTL
jgi:hypothetical protein